MQPAELLIVARKNKMMPDRVRYSEIDFDQVPHIRKIDFETAFGNRFEPF